MLQRWNENTVPVYLGVTSRKRIVQYRQMSVSACSKAHGFMDGVHVVVVVAVIPRLHDTTGCQTGCTAGLTTGCIV